MTVVAESGFDDGAGGAKTALIVAILHAASWGPCAGPGMKGRKTGISYFDFGPGSAPCRQPPRGRESHFHGATLSECLAFIPSEGSTRVRIRATLRESYWRARVVANTPTAAPIPTRHPRHHCGIIEFRLARCVMIDHERLQKGRAWGYAAGAVALVVVVVWRILIH